MRFGAVTYAESSDDDSYKGGRSRRHRGRERQGCDAFSSSKDASEGCCSAAAGPDGTSMRHPPCQPVWLIGRACCSPTHGAATYAAAATAGDPDYEGSSEEEGAEEEGGGEDLEEMWQCGRCSRRSDTCISSAATGAQRRVTSEAEQLQSSEYTTPWCEGMHGCSAGSGWCEDLAR